LEEEQLTEDADVQEEIKQQSRMGGSSTSTLGEDHCEFGIILNVNIYIYIYI
jgi:hypothetical protein